MSVNQPRIGGVARSAEGRWEGDLMGPFAFLQLFPNVFAGSNVFVYAKDGRYVLTGDSLVGIIEPEQACREAKALVDVVNCLAELIWPGFEPKCLITVVREINEGREIRRRICSTPKAVLLVGDDGSGVPSSLLEDDGRLRSHVDARVATPQVRSALQMFGSESDPTWRVVYNVLDLATEVFGKDGLTERHWISGNDYDLLKRTANNVKSVGTAARHGRHDWQPPARPMRIERARQIIRGLLAAWLASSDAER